MVGVVWMVTGCLLIAMALRFCKGNWPLHSAIETDEKMAADLAGPGYHINRSNLLVLESKADMQKRGQASPDDGDALALTFAQPVAPVEVEVPEEEEEFGRFSGSSNSGWMR
jgi:hypothetical protein